jgi:hypothetical protein
MANAPKMTTCEVQNGTAWKVIPINEALERNERNGRCVECKMPLRAHRQARNGMAAHFEHLAKSPHCFLMTGGPAAPYVGVPQGSVSGVKLPSVLQAPVLRKARGTNPLSAPHTVKGLSVDDLADLRRKLTVVLNSFDSAGGAQREGIRSRINRLSHDRGPIPRAIAALMTTITEMRNSAEYESKVLSASECAVVRHAWQAIQEWAQSARQA